MGHAVKSAVKYAVVTLWNPLGKGMAQDFMGGVVHRIYAQSGGDCNAQSGYAQNALNSSLLSACLRFLLI